MTKKEMLQILLFLETNYKQFYKDYTKEQMGALTETWRMFFGNMPQYIVMMAIKKYMSRVSAFPPTIADVNKIIANTIYKQESNEFESWNKISKELKIAGEVIPAEKDIVKEREVGAYFDGVYKDVSEYTYSKDLAPRYNEKIEKWDGVEFVMEEYTEKETTFHKKTKESIMQSFTDFEKEIISELDYERMVDVLKFGNTTNNEILRKEYLQRYNKKLQEKNIDNLEKLNELTTDQIEFLVEDIKLIG